VKQHDIITGGSSETKPPSRKVLNDVSSEHIESCTDDTTCPVYVTANETPKIDPEAILTRNSNPQNPERVKRIIQEVTIGPDITDGQ
jgi:hypothetical protein